MNTNTNFTMVALAFAILSSVATSAPGPHYTMDMHRYGLTNASLVQGTTGRFNVGFISSTNAADAETLDGMDMTDISNQFLVNAYTNQYKVQLGRDAKAATYGVSVGEGSDAGVLAIAIGSGARASDRAASIGYDLHNTYINTLMIPAGTPVLANHAATKAYVDKCVASGVDDTNTGDIDRVDSRVRLYYNQMGGNTSVFLGVAADRQCLFMNLGSPRSTQIGYKNGLIGAFDAGGFTNFSVALPTASDHAANKGYVDSYVAAMTNAVSTQIGHDAIGDGPLDYIDGRYSVAIGYRANGVTSGVAIGAMALANSSGVAIGSGSKGSDSGVAVGVGSDGQVSGVGIGASAEGSDNSVGIGVNAYSRDHSDAVGFRCNATNCSAVVGESSVSYVFSAALGSHAHAKNWGTALGTLSFATNYSVAVGVASTAITFGVSIGYQSMSRGSACSIGTGLYNTVSDTVLLPNQLPSLPDHAASKKYVDSCTNSVFSTLLPGGGITRVCSNISDNIRYTNVYCYYMGVVTGYYQIP